MAAMLMTVAASKMYVGQDIETAAPLNGKGFSSLLLRVFKGTPQGTTRPFEAPNACVGGSPVFGG